MDPNQDQSGEQPVVTQSENPGGEQPQAGNAQSLSLDDYSADELMAALEAEESGTPPVSETPSQPIEEEAEEAAPEGEESQEEPNADPEPDEEEEPTQEEEKPQSEKGPSRVSVRSLPADQQRQVADAVAMVRNGEAKDVAEAMRIITGEAPTPPQTDATPADPFATATETTPEPSTVAEIKDQIKSLREERRKAKVEFDTDRESDLTEQIEDAQRALFHAEAEEKQQALSAKSYEEQFDAAVATVEEKYPDLQDLDSVFSRLLDDKIEAAKARGDAAIRDPNFVHAYADEVAKILGVGTKKQGTPQRPPARQSRPVGSSVASGHGTQPRISREEAKSMIANAPIEVLEQIAYTE